MTTRFTIHYPGVGDRWDTVANAVYFNPFRYAELMVANPDLIGILTFDGGEAITVPVDDTLTLDSVTPQRIGDDKLPPWRRSNV